jgi:endonuclease YncB( thermonuclease family)
MGKFMLCILLAIPLSAAEIKGKVIKVYDGDTITVLDELDGGKFRIRLAGINAPEKGQPGDKEVTAFLTRRLLGEKVSVRYKAIDIYRRPLGTVWHNGENISQLLLNKKLAVPYTRAKKVEK